ncbi:MAG: hypothetical protein ACRDKL_09325 [Solirubrobacteraceae bacterium]
MKVTLRLCAIATTAALATAAPALAAKPSHPSHPTHPAKSHKCAVHHVAYIASGALATWSATLNTDGTYSGQIGVDVKRANHHAAGSMGQQTFTLTEAKVRFGNGAMPAAPGERVKLIGKITQVAKKCSDQTGAGTVTVRRVYVKTAK